MHKCINKSPGKVGATWTKWLKKDEANVTATVTAFNDKYMWCISMCVCMYVCMCVCEQ